MAGVVDAAAGRGQPLAGQSYDERGPAPALVGLVSTVWVQRIAAGTAPYTHRSVPNGSVELRCRIGSTPQVVGPLTRPLVEVLEPGTTIVGIRFRPGAAAAVLGLPASELVDLTVESDELLGRPARMVGELVAGSPSPAEALALLQRQVMGRLADAADPDPLIAEAVQRLMPWHARDVGSLRSALGISERQLRRRCQASVGLGPKALHRLLRFQGFLALTQQALTRGQRPAEDGLAMLAAEAGYTDQPHLNRECLRLTGQTPAVFLGETARHCGCGHDHAASYEPLLRNRATMAVSYKRPT
jgi:AraC-like DNA-binding protein